MDIIDNKEKMIFKNEKDGKVSYLIGLSKKKEDGTFENGYTTTATTAPKNSLSC